MIKYKTASSYESMLEVMNRHSCDNCVYLLHGNPRSCLGLKVVVEPYYEENRCPEWDNGLQKK